MEKVKGTIGPCVFDGRNDRFLEIVSDILDGTVNGAVDYCWDDVAFFVSDIPEEYEGLAIGLQFPISWVHKVSDHEYYIKAGDNFFSTECPFEMRELDVVSEGDAFRCRNKTKKVFDYYDCKWHIDTRDPGYGKSVRDFLRDSVKDDSLYIDLKEWSETQLFMIEICANDGVLILEKPLELYIDTYPALKDDKLVFKKYPVLLDENFGRIYLDREKYF